MPELPEELYALIKGYTVTRYPWYETPAKIYRLESKSETLYLKLIHGEDAHSLERDSKILDWIGERIPVPRLLFYGCEDGVEYQLTSEIKGTPTHKIQPHERENAVKVLGKSLRHIHSLDPQGCPIENTVDTPPSDAQSLDVCEGYDELPVFTHGDYCLPNILLTDGVLGGDN